MATVISKKFMPYIDDIEAISDRTIRVQFRGVVKTNVIGIYAPTAPREASIKDQFFTNN